MKSEKKSNRDLKEEVIKKKMKASELRLTKSAAGRSICIPVASLKEPLLTDD